MASFQGLQYNQDDFGRNMHLDDDALGALSGNLHASDLEVTQIHRILINKMKQALDNASARKSGTGQAEVLGRGDDPV